ncbi:MAG TPA: DUF6788 family protein [Ktedonobacteraceae bacterium]
MNGKVTYRQQYTRCGKQRCRKCKEGTGHGPYWYAYWSENGRTISKYIGIHPPEEVALKGQPVAVAQHEEDTQTATNSILPSRKTIPLALPLPPGVNETLVRETKQQLVKPYLEVTGSQPLVRVYLLGHFRVERKEKEEWQTVANRTWQRRRARALLGCLLSQTGRRMGREQVMEALWPELDIETAANRLNGAVHELRQILEPEIERPAASKLLRLERDILMLADATQIWVDAEAFETLLNRVNLTRDQAQIEQMLEEAWELYEGDYLLEELYSEWASARRESLRRGWMGLLLNLARLRAERGALTSAIEPLDRLLTADPTHETAVRRLMVLLTQLDRRGEAIRAYQRLTTILKRDYESEPLSETMELYKALRQGQLQGLLPLNDSITGGISTRQPVRHNQEKTTHLLPHTLIHNSGKTASPAHSLEQDLTSAQQLPRPVSPPGRHNLSPLIGRERELETTRELLLAINDLSPRDERKKTNPPEHRPKLAHCVMIMGETGIGKTRMAEELSQQAHALGWRVAWTRAYEQEGTIPYRPWTDILRTLLQDIPMDQLTSMVDGKKGQLEGETPGALNPAATTQAKLHRLSSLLPELATAQETQLQQARAQTPAAPEQERFHLWEAMLSLLNALAQSAPLLLVLDDLHWTDDSSLELLAYLARHQQNERIMLVGTCRDIELAPSASLRSLLNDLRREQVLVTFPLQPLTQPQIARLIAHLPHELVRRIQSQAGGNPLFAEELARFSETIPSAKLKKYNKNDAHYVGQLDEQTVSINVTDASSPTPLPETIAAVLERRLNKLGESCQILLSKAAVLGRSFEFSLLTRMTGEADNNEDATLDLLEEALRSGLLTEEVNGSRIVYHFWHPLIVSHLYERLSAARRAQLHRRAAQALIELYPSNESKGAAAIAHHLSKYGQDKQKLAYYAEIAGNQAMTLSAYSEALHYYRLALTSLEDLSTGTSLAEQDALHIARLLECMAECNDMQGNAAEARQQYTHALELHTNLHKDASMFTTPEAFQAWQEEETQVEGLLWRSIGRVWKYIGEVDLAHDCAKRGKQVLREAGITTGAAWACLEHLDGSTYWAEGNFSEARHYVEKSLKIHEEMRRKIQENANNIQAGLAYRQETPAPPMTHSRRVLLGDPLELGRTHESLGVIAASQGQYAEALQHLHTALTIFENHELVGVMSQVCSNIGAVHSMRTEYTIATTYFKRALELGERISDRRSKLLVTGNLGDIAARNGDLQEAATWMAESLALSEQASNREHTSWALVTLAAVQQDLGDMRGALENIRRALAAARNIKSTTRLGFALVALANWRVTRALILSQQQSSSTLKSVRIKRENPECLRLLKSAQAAIERTFQLTDIDTETECTGQVVLTEIYYHLGDLERARQQAGQALEETRLSEMMHLIGRVQRLQGEIQVASGLEREADASFEQALQTLKEHGLRLDYARALHRYGLSLLTRNLHVKSSQGAYTRSSSPQINTGLNYLHEARAIFVTCLAGLDLQWIEETLTDPVFLFEEI